MATAPSQAAEAQAQATGQAEEAVAPVAKAKAKAATSAAAPLAGKADKPKALKAAERSRAWPPLPQIPSTVAAQDSAAMVAARAEEELEDTDCKYLDDCLDYDDDDDDDDDNNNGNYDNYDCEDMDLDEEEEENEEAAVGVATGAVASGEAEAAVSFNWAMNRSNNPRSNNPRSNIDMSLDEIIRLQRKKQSQGQAYRDKRREYQYATNRNQAYNQKSEFYNGPQRLRKWFGRQNNYRRTIQNSYKPRPFPPITRRIPGDRNNAASEDIGHNESTSRHYKNHPSRHERMGRQLSLGPSGKPLPRDGRRMMKQKQQRENKVNQNRGIPPHKVRTSDGKSPSRSSYSGRYQVQMKPGSILTVCVANPQAVQNKHDRYKRNDGESSFPKDRWNSSRTEKFQPKGISLRYNFRAVANQTKITLNERFSGLKIIKGNFTITKPGNRTVTLP
ncbi:UAP56-interacting factor-like isoform X2 [Dromiciops gliroides]|uniref:UAP56-interacting factor-like isoform X2 n=1 Tax=Dromiciops gliroides TaxID=33562 RepID=UPI001CC6A531|nr:UAP56-interacting factor-like isoform X2 [Dromiciops gliroides]